MMGRHGFLRLEGLGELRVCGGRGGVGGHSGVGGRDHIIVSNSCRLRSKLFRGGHGTARGRGASTASGLVR